MPKLLLCLSTLIVFAYPAWADSYKLVNNSGSPLKVQSKALRVNPSQIRPAFFDLAAGETKDVIFGTEFRLWFVHIYNKDNMAQNHYWDRKPQPTDPDQHWTIVVKPGVEVSITKQ